MAQSPIGSSTAARDCLAVAENLRIRHLADHTWLDSPALHERLRREQVAINKHRVDAGTPSYEGLLAEAVEAALSQTDRRALRDGLVKVAALALFRATEIDLAPGVEQITTFEQPPLEGAGV